LRSSSGLWQARLCDEGPETEAEEPLVVSREVLEELGRRIVSGFDPIRVVLFGSYARGDATEGSDVDLLVIADTSERKPKRSAPIYSALRDFPFSKDILVYTPEEIDAYRDLRGSLIHRALEEGVVLYER